MVRLFDKRSIWDPPLNITITTVQVPATTTLTTYKSAVHNQLATTTHSKSNQYQPAATTPSSQQRQQQQRQQQRLDQDSDKMKAGSTKSDISEISKSPTIHTGMTAVSAMTEVVVKIKSVLKATDDDRKNREEKAKQSRIQREKVEKKDRADEKKVDKKEREAEESRREEIRMQIKRKPRQSGEKIKRRQKIDPMNQTRDNKLQTQSC